MNYLQDDWVKWLLLAKFTQNNTQSNSSAMLPFFANKGFHPRLNVMLASEAQDQDAEEISGAITKILELLQAKLQLSQEAQTHTANLHHLPSSLYQSGDFVWLNTKNIRTCQPCKKLDNKWIRPFKVLKTVGT